MVNKAQVALGSVCAGTGGVAVGAGINNYGNGDGSQVIGWSSYENHVPHTLHKQIVQDNYFLNIPRAWDMGVKILDASQIQANAKFSNHTCFKHFFPGVKVVNTRAKNDEKKPINASSEEATPSKSEKSPIGCSTMQLSYLPVKSGDSPEFVKGLLFKSEIVAKDENEGFALWTILDAKEKRDSTTGKGKKQKRAATIDSKWTQSLKYRFVYLSKQDSKWKVKRGYEWEESIEETNKISAYIQVPNNDLWLNTTNFASSKTNSWQHKEFAGVWRDKTFEGKGIFNDMELRMGDAGKCEVMCQNFVDFTSNVNEQAGFKTAKYHYSPVDKKWFLLEEGERGQVPALLDQSYKWIKGKVGKWEDVNRVCYGNSDVMEDANKVKEELINFCYAKRRTEDLKK